MSTFKQSGVATGGLSSDTPEGTMTTPAPTTSAAATVSSLVHDRPIAIPQQQPSATAPFFPAYAPSLQDHGLSPAAWRDIVANINEAVCKTDSVSDKALLHARSFHRSIRATMGVALCRLSPPSHPRRSSSSPTHGETATKLRTPREEHVLACLAAANIAWLHPRGLHMAMADTTVLAARWGFLPSRLVEAAQPRRGEGAAAQLAALRPWIADLEVDAAAAAASAALDLAPYSLWLVVTRRAEDGAMAAMAA